MMIQSSSYVPINRNGTQNRYDNTSVSFNRDSKKRTGWSFYLNKKHNWWLISIDLAVAC